MKTTPILAALVALTLAGCAVLPGPTPGPSSAPGAPGTPSMPSFPGTIGEAPIPRAPPTAPVTCKGREVKSFHPARQAAYALPPPVESRPLAYTGRNALVALGFHLGPDGRPTRISIVESDGDGTLIDAARNALSTMRWDMAALSPTMQKQAYVQVYVVCPGNK